MKLYQRKENQIACLLFIMLLWGTLTACGNRPASLQDVVTPTETTPPEPTQTPTVRPTSTPLPSPTLTPTETPSPTPTPEPTVEPPLVIAVDGNVFVRTGPDTKYAAAGLLEGGQSAPIVGRNGDSTWWLIKIGENFYWVADEVTTADNISTEIPIATPDPNAPLQPTPTPELPTATPTPAFCDTITLIAPEAGQLIIQPEITVRWSCDGPVPPDQGFEIKLWATGEAPAGAHDAVNDVQRITYDGQIYALTLPIRAAAGFRGVNKDYLIAVALVKVSPLYEDTGLMSSPMMIRHE